MTRRVGAPVPDEGRGPLSVPAGAPQSLNDSEAADADRARAFFRDNCKGDPGNLWIGPFRADQIMNALAAEFAAVRREAMEAAEKLALALQDIIDHPGCNDPDCCDTAIAEERARKHCIAALNEWHNGGRAASTDRGSE
jgi:hypothetical protein